MSDDKISARVITLDDGDHEAPPQPMPRVMMTDDAAPIVPAQGRAALVGAPVRRKRGVVKLALAGLAVFFAGWFVVDAVAWVDAAFARSFALGVFAAAAIVGGLGGVGILVGHELRSLWRLRTVEEIQRHFGADLAHLRPAEARATIAAALAVVPKEPDVVAAVEAFQRQAQVHHTAAQQVDILSRTVMKPLDRRAEAHVRTAVLRAFGVTAISPTALSDAAFFLALGVRMVRGIASSYGHRPTSAATLHLLRRLVVEAGKLGAVDVASASLVQHLGGAITERVATSAADSLYAAYRMARLGIIVMELCRPVPFRDDAPSVTALVTRAIRRETDA